MPTVNFQFTNNTQKNSSTSGLASSEIYLFLTQENINVAWTINPTTGVASPNTAGTLATNSCTLAQLIAAGGAIKIPANPTASARIYFSNVPYAVILSAANTISGPNAQTADFYFDFIEFDLSDTLLNIDTSQVDQLGIPCSLQVTPADSDYPQGSGIVANLDRQTLIANFNAMATGSFTPFLDCVFDSAGSIFRLLSPADVIDRELAAQNYDCQSVTSGGTGDWQTTITITGPVSNNHCPNNGALQVGMRISGPFIPAGATISAVPGYPNGQTLTMTSEAENNPFVAFSSNQSLTFFNPPSTPLCTYFDIAIDEFFAHYASPTNTLQIEQNINGIDTIFSGTVTQISGINNIENSTSTYTVLQCINGTTVFNVYYPFFTTNSAAGKQTPFSVDVPPPPAWWTATSGLMSYEAPSLMVFGASGVFADNTQQGDYISGLNATVLGAIENVVVTALARGSATTMTFLQGSITPNTNSKTATVTLANDQTTQDIGHDTHLFSFRIANTPMTPQLPPTPSNTFTATSSVDILPTATDLLTFSQFYPNGGTWDAYANFLHNGTGSISIDGRAYGFAFDDQGGFSSDLNSASTTTAPASVEITLNPWSPPAIISPLSSQQLIVCDAINWINNSTENLLLSWVTVACEEINITTIPAGTQQALGPAYFMGVNVVRDSLNNVVLAYVINASTSQTVTISQAAVASAATRAQTTYPTLQSFANNLTVSNFSVINSSDVALNLYWVEPSGYWQQIGRVLANTNLQVGPVYFGGVFVLRYDANIVSVFVVSNAADQTMTVTQAIVDFWNND